MSRQIDSLSPLSKPNVWPVQTSLCLCVVSLLGLRAAPRPRVRRTAALASLPSLQQAVAAIPDGAGKYALALPAIGGCELAQIFFVASYIFVVNWKYFQTPSTESTRPAPSRRPR